MKTLVKSLKSIVLPIIALTLFFSSCDKVDELLLSDSEKLMKDLKGKYTLVSVRHEEYYSVNGGVDWILQTDTTFSATGFFDLSNIDMANYTGTLTIQYAGFNESHAVNGSAFSDDYERLWVITDQQESINCLILFNPPANYLQGAIEERSNDHFILMFGEESWDSSGRKYRYFKFEKTK